MELTKFIEELLNVKLLDYQKIAINNFNKNIKTKPKYTILNSYDRFEDDGFLGSSETYYQVRDNQSNKILDIHEDCIHNYRT